MYLWVNKCDESKSVRVSFKQTTKSGSSFIIIQLVFKTSMEIKKKILR
jgi:hypothetical protein